MDKPQFLHFINHAVEHNSGVSAVTLAYVLGSLSVPLWDLPIKQSVISMLWDSIILTMCKF